MEGINNTPEGMDLVMVGAEAEDKKRSQKLRNRIGYHLDKKPDEYWDGYASQEEHDAHVGDLAGGEAMAKQAYKNAFEKAQTKGLSREDSSRSARAAEKTFRKSLGIEKTDILNDV